DAPDGRVAKRRHDRPQVVGSQADIAVADHEDVVARVAEPARHVVDLAVRAGTAVLDGNRDPVGPELGRELAQERQRGVIPSLNGKDDLEARVVLQARRAQVLALVLLEPVDWFQDGDRRQVEDWFAVLKGWARAKPERGESRENPV